MSSRRTTCATSTLTTRSFASCRADRPEPRRWRRSSGSCSNLYADPDLDQKPALLTERGGAFYSEAAVDLTAALLADGPVDPVQVVNTRNDGALPFLPDDAVIEVPAQIGPAGAQSLPVPSLEPLYVGLVAAVTAYEHLALDAALHGGRDRIFQALLAHPLVGQIDQANALTDRLIAHNHDYLPWA